MTGPAPQRDLILLECAAAGLLRCAEDQHPASVFQFVGTAMPEGEGSLFDDLDAALQSGSSKKRVAMVRQVTDLFLSEADRLNEEQISVFDNVLVQPIERIETRTLVEISECLAPVANAPIDLTAHLARHSEIGIAGPILVSSTRLAAADLVEIAKTKTVSAILAIKLPPESAPKAGHEKLKIDFAKLSKSNAQRLLRFCQVREVSARSA